jgi:hypothetical protein
MDGIDEDHCEELEFNHCEENEYRCQDGSCIAEQYWLDGTFDCSDKSDEQQIGNYIEDSEQCPVTSFQFNCDEATAQYKDFSCGDGQFIFREFHGQIECDNYRRNMFFCEFMWNVFTENMWTLENGHCVNEGWIEKNFIDMDEQEKCVFYLKCHLTNGKNVGCKEAMNNFHSLCKDKRINYPSQPFFTPYIYTVYELKNIRYVQDPNYAYFNGSIKCIGYNTGFNPYGNLFYWDMIIEEFYFDFDRFFCTVYQMMNTSVSQFDTKCWNDTKQSFFCEGSYRCISRYRVEDGYSDCGFREDETTPQGCQIKQKHRLNCLGKRPMCLPVSKIGEDFAQCQDAEDEYLKLLRWKLTDHKCTASNSLECTVLKTYIQSPSTLLTIRNINILLFRQYCDTVFQLSMGFDESLCTEWICSNDHYQCLSGHCTPISFMIDRDQRDWQCPDASDKLAFFRTMELSQHNARFVSLFQLSGTNNYVADYIEQYTGFFKICQLGEEYGCLLAGVDEPLNFTLNRPCINLTQIGDGIIDCYGGLDERNTLICGNNTFQQRGFDFHCNYQECIPYSQLCEQRCSNGTDSLLCDKIPSLRNPLCRNSSRSEICDISLQLSCQLPPVHDYYCDYQRLSKYCA